MPVMRATELTDEHWQGLQPLLPPRRTRGCPRGNHHNTLNGILYGLWLSIIRYLSFREDLSSRHLGE